MAILKQFNMTVSKKLSLNHPTQGSIKSLKSNRKEKVLVLSKWSVVKNKIKLWLVNTAA